MDGGGDMTMDPRIGHRVRRTVTVVRESHVIGFSRGMSASQIARMLAEVPATATVDEVSTDDTGVVTSIDFIAEKVPTPAPQYSV